MSLFDIFGGNRAAAEAQRNYELARMHERHMRREAAERMARLDGKAFKCGPWRWRTRLHISTYLTRGQIHPVFTIKAERIET